MSTSAQDVIERSKTPPPKDRAEVAKFIVEHDDSWVPESFKEGMADIAAGRVIHLDEALTELDRP